jgi:hypothetical protein
LNSASEMPEAHWPSCRRKIRLAVMISPLSMPTSQAMTHIMKPA